MEWRGGRLLGRVCYLVSTLHISLIADLLVSMPGQLLWDRSAGMDPVTTKMGLAHV